MLIGFLLCFCRSDTRDSTVINTGRRRVCIITRETLDSHITRHRVSNCAPVRGARSVNSVRLITLSSNLWRRPRPLRHSTFSPRIPSSHLLLDSLTRREFFIAEKCPLGPFVANVKKLHRGG